MLQMNESQQNTAIGPRTLHGNTILQMDESQQNAGVRPYGRRFQSPASPPPPFANRAARLSRGQRPPHRAAAPTTGFFSDRGRDEEDWRRPKLLPSANQATVAASAISEQQQFSSSSSSTIISKEISFRVKKKGRLLNFHAEEGYGFLCPVDDDDDAGGDGRGSFRSRNVYMRFDDKVETGMLDVRDGDVFEYVGNEDPEQPRAVRARLIQPQRRNAQELQHYLNNKLGGSGSQQQQRNPPRQLILRNITVCPAAFLQLLNLRGPPRELIAGVLQLAVRLCCDDEDGEGGSGGGGGAARKQQFMKLFAGTHFLMHSLNDPELLALNDDQTLSNSKSFLQLLAEHGPEAVADTVPLLKRLAVDAESVAVADSAASFLVDLIARQAGARRNDCGGGRMRLLPTDKEIAGNGSSDGEALPSLKREEDYASLQEYVDTHLALLREDCYWQLKQAVRALRTGAGGAVDAKIWDNARVLGVRFGEWYTGITVALELGSASASTAPLCGHLLVLSEPGFRRPVWAVAIRTEKIIRDEYSWRREAVAVFVRILGVDGDTGGGRVEGFGRVVVAGRVVLVESRSFYPAYGPVLKALRERASVGIPFQDEILRGAWDSHEAKQVPLYLRPKKNVGKIPRRLSAHFLQEEEIPRWLFAAEVPVTFNWACVFEQQRRGSSVQKLDGTFASIVELHSMIEKVKEEERVFRGGVEHVDHLLECGHTAVLDESQLAALKHALTHRLALIQGPPGTGKTFVASKLAQLILSAEPSLEGPILIISYKNQALDHFLLSCLDFCDELVRVGGRCKESKLEDYNLSNKLQSRRMCSRWDLQADMKQSLEGLEKSNVFNVETLLEVMPDAQLRKFLAGTKQGSYRLQSLPPELPIRDIVRRSFRGTSFAVPDLYRDIQQCIQRWLPDQMYFNMVDICFNLGRLCRSSGGCVPDANMLYAANDAPEIDSDDDEYSMNDELIQGKVGHRPWLEDSRFVRCSNTDGYRVAASARSDLPLDEDHWLLQENPWDLDPQCRALLVHLILKINYERYLQQIENSKAMYDTECESLSEDNVYDQLGILRNAKIVAMTTTGAAMHYELLRRLEPEVVFVEEASEILEGQLTAVLHPKIQHLVMFGDQYQLSPQVNCYDLERCHDFGLSMFERLIEHKQIPFRRLEVQGRMRDEFLPMLTPIYPYLRSNSKLISGHRNRVASCMATSSYWWCHSHPETKRRSCSNEGEADMCLFLVRWLVSEGEKPEDITILASYKAQADLLKEKSQGFRWHSTANVNMQCIDRYQGSESRIVILSLVRSNEEGDIGFLAKRNRLCVAVSRARAGLYICANASTFTAKSQHWRTLVNCLEAAGRVGDQIPLRCPRHEGDQIIKVSSNNVPQSAEKLCEFPCKIVPKCGHHCQRSCHSDGHENQCTVPVNFIIKRCGHEATRDCRIPEDRIPCSKEIRHTFEACGHTEIVKCFTSKESRRCSRQCQKTLDCGHPCQLQCYQDCKSNPCKVCIEIQKEKLNQERQMETKKIAEKMEQLKQAIEELSKEQADKELQDGQCLEIDSEGDTAAEFLQFKDRTERFIQPKHGIVPIVTKIERVLSPTLQLKFLQAHRDLLNPTVPSQMLFHGTSEEGIQGIISNGFRLPPENRKNMFGQGIYFATDASKSAQEIYTKGSSKLLLCEVLLGRSLTVQEAMTDMNKERLNKKGYDSIFSKRDSKDSGGTEFDEFVIYNPDQAIPRYVVHYKNLKCEPANYIPTTVSSSSDNVTRIKYEKSPTFLGDSPEEYHFRLAESQFFRMSSRQDYKVETVELIINKRLQEKYETARLELNKEMVNKGKKVEEMLVFHGTGKEAIDKIVEGGFRVGGDGVPVKNGKAYGSGVYTAMDPNISVGYSARQGVKMMLLSRALIGEPGLHYSHGKSNNVFVIKNPQHLLPNYVVHYSAK